MKEYKAMAHINSLNGEMAEITVLKELGNNDYMVDYKGVKCHALFNWFVCEYYADDTGRSKSKRRSLQILKNADFFGKISRYCLWFQTVCK